MRKNYTENLTLRTYRSGRAQEYDLRITYDHFALQSAEDFPSCTKQIDNVKLHEPVPTEDSTGTEASTEF